MPDPVWPTDERVRALAEEVLARPEYAQFRVERTELQALVARFADWLDATFGWLPDRIDRNLAYLEDLLRELFEVLLATGPVGVLTRLALAAFVLAAAAAFAVAVVRSLRGRLVDDAPRDLRVVDPSSPHGLLAEADGHAAGGRFLDAAHCVQLATLELLLRREWISLERSDPNRTLRRRLDAGRVPDAERAEFLALLDRLESRWFRDRVEDRALYDAWRGLHARLDAIPPAARRAA